MMIKQKSIKNLMQIILVLASLQSVAQTAPDISLIFYLDENSETGTLVGAVVATDPDGDALTYSIVSGNDAGAFAIVGSGSMAGNITVSDGGLLDYEITPSFALMVEADDGNGGMTTASVTVNLNDIDENVLGIDDSDNIMTVYPNPVKKVFSVDLGGISASGLEIFTHTMEGRSIQVDARRISDFKLEIDATSWSAGIYLLRIQGEEIRKTIRITKN